jgi:hypothetical protein
LYEVQVGDWAFVSIAQRRLELKPPGCSGENPPKTKIVEFTLDIACHFRVDGARPEGEIVSQEGMRLLAFILKRTGSSE